MSQASSAIAKAITKVASKQSYYTISLMVDPDLVQDAFRAYGYFRWVDDFIDVRGGGRKERLAFVARQQHLMQRAYRREHVYDVTREEQILLDLIHRDRKDHSGLQYYIRNMMALMVFDARRKGRLISRRELAWYSWCLGSAVMEALHYFIGHRDLRPPAEGRYLAPIAAHITHMLRDTVLDTRAGYFNIPSEYLVRERLSPLDYGSPAYRAWVRNRVELARRHFQAGKKYIDNVDNLRFRIVGHWYCARFEWILDAIGRDRHLLRPNYGQRNRLLPWLTVGWLALNLTIKHLTERGFGDRPSRAPGSAW